MPLQGSLGHLGLADLLQTGLAGRTGGYLTLRRGAEHAVLYVGDDGLYLLSPDPLDASEVVAAFAQRGLVPGGVAERMAQCDPRETVRLLDELVASGTMPENELLDLLAGTAEDSILDLLTWDTGTFRYEEGPLDPRHVGLVGRIGVDPGGVLLRAAQRIDERGAIARMFGMHASLFVAQQVGELPREHEEDYTTPAVHGVLDGTRTLSEAALVLGIGRFATLKAVHRLVEGGAARVANAGELAALATQRLGTGHFNAARELALHWSSVEPVNPDPMALLVDVAVGRGRFEEEMAARCGLGNLLLHTSRPEEAIKAFQGALERAPHHEDALVGLRMSAEAVGDERAFARATMTLAQAALEHEDEDRAARLGDDLVRADPRNVEAHVLRARAMVKVGHREGFLESADAVAHLLGSRARRKQDRDAANYFRDVLPQIAPERSDLLRRYRTLTEGSGRKIRRAAMVLALLGIVGTAGVLFWPASPSSLLSQAQTAFDNGELGKAQQLVVELIDRFPDSPEAETAFQLQSRMFPAVPTHQGPRTTGPTKPEIKDIYAEFGEALAGLPGGVAQSALRKMVEELEKPTSVADRRKVFQEHGEVLAEVTRRMSHDARTREDVLAQAKSAAHRLDGDPDGLRAYLKEMEVARDEAYVERLEATVGLLNRLGRLTKFDLFRTALNALRESTKRYRRALSTYAGSFSACKQALARMEVKALFDRCTKEAPALLVGGRLDEADELYIELETLVKNIEKTPDLEPVRERIERLRIHRFLKDRRGMIAGIRRDLEAAEAAEAEGDLEAAVQIYTGLVQRHWQIRFENVFTLPLTVASVPSGADILVNGKKVGQTPTLIRYPWGSQTTVVVRAEGYDAVTTVIQGVDEEPPTTLDARLPLATLWSTKIGAAVTAEPIAVGDDVLVVDRSGRVALHGTRRGEVIWARHYKNVEGVRARPVHADGDVVLAYVDGRILFLSQRDGSIRSEAKTDRVLGNLAKVGSRVALVTQPGDLMVLKLGQIERKVELGIVPTAGVLAAHGAFWVGTGNGAVVRVDANTLTARRIPLRKARGAVVGLASDQRGILVACGDGRLYALGQSGSPRWQKEGLGDLVGTPAEAADVAAVADRRGRVHFFSAADGKPVAVGELDGEPRGGLSAENGVFVAGLRSGRLWVYAAKQRAVIVDADLAGDARFRPTILGDGRMAVAAAGGLMHLCVLPK
ncbi:MAG: PQQ-binding-like beta-propeller repeat protein [Planctomycetota bacterium]|nr:PQQ-binding-like beta-propeller repeat protein [Planctomycetota bacterium]